MVSSVVVAAIIRKNGQILIAQRKKDSKLEPNKWEFPGGKIEFGEHPEEALHREIKEELNLKIKIVKLYSTISHIYERNGQKHHVVLLIFLADYHSGQLKNLDVQDSKWVTPDQFCNFSFVAGDEKLLNSLAKEKW